LKQLNEKRRPKFFPEFLVFNYEIRADLLIQSVCPPSLHTSWLSVERYGTQTW